MAHYKDSINDALKYIGAEPLASEWFWSSTESSQYNAWYVYFFIGDMEVAMNFIKEAYPFNEETEVFIRKKFNMSIPVEPEE